jgi:hypothetical protein
MIKSRFAGFDSRAAGRLASLAATLLVLGTVLAAQARPPSAAARLLQQGLQAESALQVDLAIDRLYSLVIEHPQTPELLLGRLPLARLLVLTDQVSTAVLHCQAISNDRTAAEADKQRALTIATTLGRRLRMNTKAPVGGLATGVVVTLQRLRENEAAVAAASYYAAVTSMGVGGAKVEDASAILSTPAGGVVLVDPPSRRVYTIAGNSSVAVPGTAEPTAAAVLPDGAVVVADKAGFITPKGPVAMTGTFGGKTQPLARVRTMAANSRGDLFVVDRGYDGVLRCAAGQTVCQAWGPPGRYRAAKVGAADIVYLLDDSQPIVRAVDDAGRQVAAIGPMVGAIKLERLVDFAVDAIHGVYLLDAGGRRVQIGSLQASPAGYTLKEVATVPLPKEGEQIVRDPTAIGITADGAMVLATRSSVRLMLFQ